MTTDLTVLWEEMLNEIKYISVCNRCLDIVIIYIKILLSLQPVLETLLNVNSMDLLTKENKIILCSLNNTQDTF